MTQPLAVAELDPPAPDRARRALAPLSILVVLLLVGGIVAALAHDDAPSPAQRLAAAPAAVESARSFATETTTEFTIGDIHSKTTVTGEVDTVAKVASMRTEAVPGVMAPISIVLADRDLYLEVPAEYRGLTEGKGWLHARQPAPVSVGDTSGVTDPLTAIEQLSQAGSVKVIGDEDVRREPTTHYRATIDLARAVKDRAPTTTPDQAGVLEQLGDGLPVDVWLDAKGRVRKQRTEITLKTPALDAAKSVTVITTFEAFDYGRAVTVAIPDAGNVKDLGEGGFAELFAFLRTPRS